MGKKFKTNQILVAALILSCALLGSCEKNAFDPEKVKATYEDKFPVKDIDPDMDWKMTRQVTIDISVYEDYGVDYTVEIFDRNPYSTDTIPHLLARGTANQEFSFHTAIDCPTVLSTLYVSRTDEAGRRIFKPVAITNNRLATSFGSQTLTRSFSPSTRSEGNFSISAMSRPYTDKEIETMLSKAVEYTGQDMDTDIANKNIFKITSTYEGSINHGGTPTPAASTLKLIIAPEAKWEIPSSQTINQGLEIIVASKGEIKLKSGSEDATWNFEYCCLNGTAGGNGKKGNGNAVACKPGEAPKYIPEGRCTGEGNTPGEGDPGEGDPGEEPELMPYTYVFEDNFPLVGDYDFNDVVLDVSINHDRGRDNKITATHIDVTLVAAGATKTIGAGLRLVNVDRAAVASISYEGDVNRFQNTLSGSMLDNISFEDGMVIPLFGNVHGVFGVAPGTMVNTGIATAPTYTYKIKIEQSNAYQHESPVISKDNLDFFIAYKFRSMQQRMEVHLYEFWDYGATKGGTVQKENLDLAGNNTWAICVPNFRYPRESINISTLKSDDCAYPKFLDWAQNRTPDTEKWHLDPNEKNVYR